MRAGAHVARLLLGPHDLAQIRVGPDELGDLPLREGIEQFDATDRDARVVLARGVPDQVVVDLAGAQDEALDLLHRYPRLPEDGEELGLRQVLEAVGRLRQPQQRLRGHDHQRTLLGYAGLAAQEVEVLRGRREVRHADVPLRGERQEALEAGRGVLRAGALVAVREQQRQPRGLSPLREAGDDELVDDHLRAVGEVAELCLPQHEGLGRLLRVAVLEAEAGDLRQRRVVQLDRGQ